MSLIRWIVWKDVLLFLADRNGVILTVATPIALAVLFSLLFRPPEVGVRLDLLVVDEDGGPAVHELVADLALDPSLRIEAATRDEASARLQRGASPLALIVPAGAGRSLVPAGLVDPAAPTPVLLHDPSRRYEADMARGVIARALVRRLALSLARPDEVRALRDAVSAALAHVPPDDATRALGRMLDAGVELAEAATDGHGAGLGLLTLRDPAAVPMQASGPTGVAEGFDVWSHNFSGMLVMFLLFLALERAKSTLDERALGTAVRLRMAPITRRGLLLGGGLSTAALALVVSVVVFIVGAALFGVRVHGSALGFAAVLVANAVAVAGFSLLLAGLGRTATQITTVGTFAILIMSFLGGAALPTFLMPGWVQSLAAAVPTHWATKGFAAATWRGLPFEASAGPAAVLLAFGLVLGAVGARRFRWE